MVRPLRSVTRDHPLGPCRPIEAVEAQHSALRERHVRRGAHDPNGDADVDVALSTASHVIVEAQEIAERHGRPELATLAGRYELLFDIAKSDLVYNTLARISGELETVCGGVIYAANDGRFV